MNAMKNEKGRQTKLLAAIAILAMVVCAFAVAMPSDDVNATPTTPEKAPLGEVVGEFTYANGVYTVSADHKVDLATEGYNLGTADEPLDIRFEISNGATLTTTTAQAGQTITLYAQWKSQVNYIQNFTLADCQSQASSGNVTVVDSRDNNSYTVRYINGACWMTQNLRLAGGTKLTTSDSNVTRDYTLPTTQLAGNSYSYTAPQTTISSNTSYGGYYNYCAASAGTVCSSSSAQNASQDICPKGWRLPTLNEMSGITSYTSAFSPVYSGYYINGSLYDTGSFGYWWSATASGSYYQYSLYYYGGSLYTSYDGKRLGFSVRCIRSS